MNLVIDIGNTKVKAAVFESDTIKVAYVFDEVNFFEELEYILEKHKITQCILSSVKETREDYIQKLEKISFFIVLDSSIKVPFKNLYSTPTTLGIDRIALAAAAVSLYPQKNTLIIDAGTCITYDFVNLKSEYLGGAISPGIDIRYQSLHHYTSKLPKLIKSEVHNLIGTSTSEAIHSGVINGVIHEINGIIRQYELDYHDLTVVLTGGDTKFLFKQLKNSIFANQNFLLHGLNKILTFNNQ